MYRKFITAASFASVLAAPAAASAAGTTLRQTVMAELRYDTNANIAAQGQQSEGDFVLVVAPGFQAVNQRNNLTLTGNYRPTGYFYFQDSDLNTISHSAALAADYDFSTLTSMTVEDRFTYTRESLESTLSGIQNRRNTIMTNTLNFSLSHQLTRRTGVSVSASDFILNFEDPVAVDSRNNSGSLAVSFQATPDTQLTGSYNFSHVKYDLPGGASSSQNTHSLNAGFNTRFRQDTSLLMSAGAVYADASAGDGFFDWVAVAELRKTWQRDSANISYTRRTTSSSGITDQLTLNDSIAAGYSHRFERNVSVNAFGTFTRNHTKPNDNLDTKSFTAGASANWQMRSWLSFGLGFSHFKQEADGPLGDDIERDHFFINVQATTYERRI